MDLTEGQDVLVKAKVAKIQDGKVTVEIAGHKVHGTLKPSALAADAEGGQDTTPILDFQDTTPIID